MSTQQGDKTPRDQALYDSAVTLTTISSLAAVVVGTETEQSLASSLATITGPAREGVEKALQAIEKERGIQQETKR